MQISYDQVTFHAGAHLVVSLTNPSNINSAVYEISGEDGIVSARENVEISFCPICQDVIFDSEHHTTPCGHLYHSSCISKANKAAYPHQRCPVCRNPIKMNTGDVPDERTVRFQQTTSSAEDVPEERTVRFQQTTSSAEDVPDERTVRFQQTTSSNGHNLATPQSRNLLKYPWLAAFFLVSFAIIFFPAVVAIYFQLLRPMSEPTIRPIRCSTADLKSSGGNATGIFYVGVSSYLNGLNVSYCQPNSGCAQACAYLCKPGWGHLTAIKQSAFIPRNLSATFIQPCIQCMDFGMWSPGGNISTDGFSSFPQPCYPCRKCASNQEEISPCTADQDTACSN